MSKQSFIEHVESEPIGYISKVKDLLWFTPIMGIGSYFALDCNLSSSVFLTVALTIFFALFATQCKR
jgi:hypothetical protein